MFENFTRLETGQPVSNEICKLDSQALRKAAVTSTIWLCMIHSDNSIRLQDDLRSYKVYQTHKHGFSYNAYNKIPIK